MVRCKKGQSIVEFALILPIVLLLIMGVLDLGRAFFMKIALVNA
ncbi:MAG: pilus assembly protein, partial [Anaerolineaceae bacterium]|nr:pilus assembly protein [Anaerolineaceae bacterium]